MLRPCRPIAALLLAAALLLTGCSPRGPAAPAPVTLRIAGSSSMAPLLAELAQAHQAQHPEVLIDLRAGGSQTGVAELQAGQVDLAAISWQPAAARPPAGFQAFPIGRDAIAAIVHPRNTTPGLTILQLRAIFRGETRAWDTLNGPATDPVIVSREDGSGTRAAFEALVMGNERVTLNALVMPSSRAVVEYVAAHRAAIGYVSLAWADDRVRVVPVEDVTPDNTALRSGAYHLTRILYLYAPQRAAPAAQAFVDFALSPAGQAIVAQHYGAVR